ncbi:hypothetical protein P7D22_05810 [Lichenihabitans sp. Uapishka_5]|uniref:hypothetical protein n=1 Tax=Lichenihabitans sp. Uapishka_5 TaxID=3037302 RepID=UPI0029E80E9C|nr:hypothetical protein [Lichenihabitans sp. Uapishka_5]MDX7950694.1 hypothetical protein [Lichenihabitans sp. Uapishka_5]
MLETGNRANRPIDQLRPGLIGAILHRLYALNANTRLLLQLLEEQDWHDIGARAFRHLGKRLVH